MTKKTFSTDGLFRAQYTFLVAGGEYQIKFFIPKYWEYQVTFVIENTLLDHLQYKKIL